MLRLAVVGAGIMGTNHARVAATVRGVELTHVVDPDVARAGVLGAAHGATSAGSINEILGRIDAAVIAVPTELHRELAIKLLDAGIPVLVEKPLAATVEDAEAIVACAAAAGVTLMVGHVERFNPAVLELDNLVHEPLHLRTARISPRAPRVSVGVVLDLMIHDLDIARTIARSQVTAVSAVARGLEDGDEDLATALLTFENGVTADLTASRMGQQKIRSLAITQRDSYLEVDLLRQDVTISRVEHSEYVSAEGARYRQTGVIEIPFLEHRGEPLQLELQDFVNAVETGSPVRVSGADGLEALRLAQWVSAAASAPTAGRV